MDECLLAFSLPPSITGCNAVAVRSSHQSDIYFKANLLELKYNLVWEPNMQDETEIAKFYKSVAKVSCGLTSLIGSGVY